MQVFILASTFDQSAKALCDQHIIKQILESCQLLCTALRETGYTGHIPYKSTHKNHPVTKWIIDNKSRYMLVYDYTKVLLQEYTYRTGKIHKCSQILNVLPTYPSVNYSYDNFPLTWSDSKATTEKGIVTAFRKYYKNKLTEWLSRDKPFVPRWTKRTKPRWLTCV